MIAIAREGSVGQRLLNSSNRMLKVAPHSYMILLLFLELPPKKKKLGKNPDVDTSFLPDRDREVG